MLLVGFARGTYDSHPLTALRSEQAPAWTRPCLLERYPPEGAIACDRVAGRVVWIERKDADGDGDRHLVLVSRLRLRVVKLPETFPLRTLPSIGAAVAATGPVTVGAAGKPEILAERFRTGGETTLRR